MRSATPGPAGPRTQTAVPAINTAHPLLRAAISATLAISGLIHTYLYVHGYR